MYVKRISVARGLIVLERSLASCVRSHDISSPEADAPWPRLTPLGDTGLHRPCVFTGTIRRYDGAEARLFLLCAETRDKKGARIAKCSHMTERFGPGVSRRLLWQFRFIAFFVYFHDGIRTTSTIHYYFVSHLLQDVSLYRIHRILRISEGIFMAKANTSDLLRSRIYQITRNEEFFRKLYFGRKGIPISSKNVLLK